MKLLCIAFAGALLAACTVTPPLRTQGYPTYDASTPPPYPKNNSGILATGHVGGRDVLVITAKRAASDAAARPCRDRYGNHVFAVPLDHYAKPYNAVIDAQKAQLEATR